jgi:AraC-like DNA-binding protein
MIYYSELQEFYSPHAFRSLSVKFVIEEAIHYNCDGKEYNVEAGHYMLACKHSSAQVYFEAREKVKSICIDICPSSFAEAYTVITSKNDEMDDYLSGYFKHPYFYENVNALTNGSIDKKLADLLCKMSNGDTGELNKDWFLDLIEKIIYKEYGNYLSLKNIHSAKVSTRKEILNRVQKGKAFMDENFLTIGEVKEVSRMCLMSEYHFFRSFKQAYHITPFQYLSNKRLEYAKELLCNDELTVASIAYVCNYPDSFTFSKAFKKRFGMSPTLCRKMINKLYQGSAPTLFF